MADRSPERFRRPNPALRALHSPEPPRRDIHDGQCVLVPEGFRNPLAPVADAPAPVLLPLIRADDDVTPALERALHPVAIRAQTGDRAARDALYTAFEPKLMRFTWRIRVPFAPGGAKGIWERDDVVQEAYLAFISMVENWSPAIPFGRYVLANFPWRLRDAVHRGVGKRGLPPRTHGVPIDTGAVVVDASTAAVEQRTLLLALAASLERPRDEVFRLHIVDGLSLTEAALRMGISRRTITRHWRAIMLDLRSDLITRADGDPIDR